MRWKFAERLSTEGNRTHAGYWSRGEYGNKSATGTKRKTTTATRKCGGGQTTPEMVEAEAAAMMAATAGGRDANNRSGRRVA